MTKDEDEPYLISGLVKWYDPTKGFGFIVNGDDESDILLHANVLRNFGRGSVADQSRISVLVQQTNRGLQAVKIVAIDPPASNGAPPIDDIGQEVIEQIESLPLLPARVKWFDKGKGFGFANMFCSTDDIFIHIEVLRHSGFADLATGEAISLRVVEGRRGLMAAQVCSWDSASQRSGPREDECRNRAAMYLKHVAE